MVRHRKYFLPEQAGRVVEAYAPRHCKWPPSEPDGINLLLTIGWVSNLSLLEVGVERAQLALRAQMSVSTPTSSPLADELQDVRNSAETPCAMP
jgi:hypothetical protein